MSLQVYLAFVAACIALALLPGPVVTLLIANGLRHGTRAALINMAGVQTGLLIMIGIVAIGLTSLMATMGYWFNWVRLFGAAYLIWLGIKLIRSPVEGIAGEEAPPPPRGGFFLQGLLVLVSNPKLLIFFGAFLLGLWCGWMWWGRRVSQDAQARREQLMDLAMVALFVLVLALIFLGILALFEGYLPSATR